MGNPLKKDVRVFFVASSRRSLQSLFQFPPGKETGIFMVETLIAGSCPGETAACTNRRVHIIACRSSRLCWRLVKTTGRRLDSRSKEKAGEVEDHFQSSTKMFC